MCGQFAAGPIKRVKPRTATGHWPVIWRTTIWEIEIVCIPVLDAHHKKHEKAISCLCPGSWFEVLTPHIASSPLGAARCLQHKPPLGLAAVKILQTALAGQPQLRAELLHSYCPQGRAGGLLGSLAWHIILLIVAQPGRKRDSDASAGEPPAFGKIVQDHLSRVFV